jgi:hypothetical protein
MLCQDGYWRQSGNTGSCLLPQCGAPEADASDGDVDAVDDVGSTPDVGVPPIDPSAQLRNLTTAQISALCDWENAATGGYGARWTCGINSPDNALCVYAMTVAFASDCDQTIAEVVACTYAELAELPSCEYPAECVLLEARCPHGDAGGDGAASADSALGE